MSDKGTIWMRKGKSATVEGPWEHWSKEQWAYVRDKLMQWSAEAGGGPSTAYCDEPFKINGVRYVGFRISIAGFVPHG